MPDPSLGTAAQTSRDDTRLYQLCQARHAEVVNRYLDARRAAIEANSIKEKR